MVSNFPTCHYGVKLSEVSNGPVGVKLSAVSNGPRITFDIFAADRWKENLKDQGRLQQDPGLHRAVPLPQEPRSPRKRSCDCWYLPFSPVLIMFHCSAGGAGPFLTAAPLQQPSQEVEIWNLA